MGGDVKALLEQAFPDQSWDDDQVAAFKEAILSCSDPMEEEYEEETPSKGGKGKMKGDGLALVFGGKK